MDTIEYYPNGVSTSLPLDIQLKMLHSIEGLENVEITKPGYGIEHDVIDPLELYPSLETKRIPICILPAKLTALPATKRLLLKG